MTMKQRFAAPRILGLLLALSFAAVPLHVWAGETPAIEVEAESGVLLGHARLIKSGDLVAVDGLTAEGDGLTVTVTVPETGSYDIAVVSASAGQHKENYLDVDGQRIGAFVTESRDYEPSLVPAVYLEAGEHTLTITSFWGWITIDKLTLTPSAALPADLYEVKPALVNPNASENARRLMAYLCDCYGTSVISGQYCDQGMFGPENTAIFKETGEYPAILGLDLMNDSPANTAHGTKSQTVEQAIQYWNAGGIVTICWHWTAPSEYLTGTWYSAFYTEHTNIDLQKIMNGEDSAGYDLLLRDMDAIARQLQRLRDAGVPVLWRPLHEASGGWFWWGAKGSDAYIALYRLMFDRFTHEYGLDNLIWVWNGQDPAWYPGDAYVDIIGEDIYPGEKVYTAQMPRFLAAADYTDSRKIIALSENGCLMDPDLMARDGAMWSYTGTWNGEFVLKNKTYISDQYTDLDMLRKFYQHERVITRKELPDLKNYPLSD